jgi:thiol-disulfide isomerase/thioredoxin
MLRSRAAIAATAIRENRPVSLSASQLLLIVAAASAAIAAGIALLGASKWRAFAWASFVLGVGVLGLLVLMQVTGRFGPEHLWFRAPSFYIASVMLATSLVWWLRRPAPRALRFGLPVLLLACVALAGLIARFDGRSAPLAMLLPTLDAPAPELGYFDTSGHRRTLAELRGNVVLLNFWATWCAPCRKEMPMLSKLQREFGRQGLVVLYVSLEEPEVLEPFLAANHFDGIQGRLDHAEPYYDAGKFYPLSYLISRDGRIQHRWSGRPREEWLTARVEEELQGSETRQDALTLR